MHQLTMLHGTGNGTAQMQSHVWTRRYGMEVNAETVRPQPMSSKQLFKFADAFQ